MRIEINSGGFGSNTVSSLQNDWKSYISNAEDMVNSFKTVKSSAYSLNGGVGSLDSALDDLELSINQAKEKIQSAKDIQTQTDDFIDLANRVDSQVAKKVNTNKNEFYDVNPWLKPATSKDEKEWYEAAWDWVVDKTEDAIDYVKEHWVTLTVEITCIALTAIAVACIPVTGGASIALIAVCSGLSAGFVTFAGEGEEYWRAHGSLEGFDFKQAFKDSAVSFGIGLITGAIGAGINVGAFSALGKMSWSSTLLNSSSTVTRMLSWAGINSVVSMGSGIATRATSSVLYGIYNDDLTLDSFYEDTFNVKDILYDGFSGGIKGAIKSKKTPVGKQLTTKNQEDSYFSDKEKPLNSPTVDNWTEKGGKIYVDGNGVYTYVAKDGTTVVYSDGPDFKRAGHVSATYTVKDNSFDTSNHGNDINEAIKATGKGGHGSGYTWHHTNDGKTLYLVDSKTHRLFTHRGGFSIAKNGG